MDGWRSVNVSETVGEEIFGYLRGNKNKMMKGTRLTIPIN
jgi:hypothetical protein